MSENNTSLQTKETAVEVRRKSQLGTIRDLLDRSKAQLAMALPAHLTPERLLRVSITSIQKNPRLLECTPVSLLAAIMEAAQLGLEPDGLLGLAHLVPFKNSRKNVYECQLQPGYKGLLKLARNSGEISTCQARVVYAKDEFAYRYGLHAELHHIPTTQIDPGPVTYVYAVLNLKDGGHQFEVWPVEKINAHRDRYSQSWKTYGKTSVWGTNWEEMAKKTVIKAVCKLAPSSVELARAIALDDKDEVGLPQDLAPTFFESEEPTPEDEPGAPQGAPAAAGQGAATGADSGAAGDKAPDPIPTPTRKTT